VELKPLLLIGCDFSVFLNGKFCALLENASETEISCLAVDFEVIMQNFITRPSVAHGKS